MSYNPNPQWTDNIDSSSLENIVCPHCGEKPANYETVVENLFNDGYYEPRHIPPSLTFTCFNEECEHCDEDFTVNLSLVIDVI